MKNILFKNQDLGYRDFHSRLVPTINPDTIIGVRTPVLRKIARDFKGSEERGLFLNSLPHNYYEENNLHAFFIEQIADYDLCIRELNRFLPYVDNWATCDSMRPKCFKKNTDRLLAEIERWIKSEHIYTVRFAVEMLMVYYLDEKFNREYPRLAASVQSDEYYINMMLAWYFATALAKQWDEVLPYITEYRLPVWVHNKAIQKATESYRITDCQKTFLKKYKIGGKQEKGEKIE